MLADTSLSEFNRQLASSAPVPGGGGVSALAGALGTGLSIMVGCLTVGKKKYAETEEEMKGLMKRAEELQKRLLELIDEDAAGFEPLSKAYGLPKDTPDRDNILEVCLVDAIDAPLEIFCICNVAIDIAERVSQIGSTLAISDAGCAASICRAAMESAALNVIVNTRLMKDRARAERINVYINQKLADGQKKAAVVFTNVYGRLS